MIKQIDCLEGLRKLESNSVNCIVTSPPYNKKGLLKSPKKGNQIWGKFNIDYNSYGDDMPEPEYQAWMVEVLNECHRVLAEDGSFFFNHKPRRYKNRCWLPTDFISRSDAQLYQLIIWDRRNSPNIRNDVLVPCTEHVYWFCKKKPKVFRDAVDPAYRGEIWVITPEKQKLHPAPFPETLVRNCVSLSTEEGDLVLDPFAGSGTTLAVANQLGRNFLGFDIDEKYVEMAKERVR
jgi:site-specific DNA-methyltransferase (adenine-specific)